MPTCTPMHICMHSLVYRYVSKLKDIDAYQDICISCIPTCRSICKLTFSSSSNIFLQLVFSSSNIMNIPSNLCNGSYWLRHLCCCAIIGNFYCVLESSRCQVVARRLLVNIQTAVSCLCSSRGSLFW